MAGEAWVLWWLAAFQFAVAYWWWKGPHPAGTRVVVPGLFALNALATIGASLAELAPSHLFTALSTVSDRWTNLFLLGVSVAALPTRSRLRRAGHILLVLGAFGLLVATPSTLRGTQQIGGDAQLYVLAVEVSLVSAILLAVPALLYHSKHSDERQSRVWLVVLGALCIRYAELATVNFLPRVVGYSQSMSMTGTLNMFMGVLAFLVMALAFCITLVFRHRAPGSRTRTFDMVTGLLLAGFLVGAARIGQPSISTAVFFTLAFIRPALFLVAQAHLEGKDALRHPRGHVAAGGAFVLMASLGGLFVAESLWQMGPLRALTIAGAFALMAYPGGARLARELPSLPPSYAPQTPAAEHTPWPVDEDRVNLPDGWRGTTDANYAVYQGLSASVKTELTKLARWQRLLLALDAIPEDAPQNAFDRSTPGLHLATQCPYNIIGSELRRANGRCEAILSELEMPRPKHFNARSSPLVEDTWGRAKGLRSGRAKLYTLTPLGQQVAARIREMAGLGDLSREEVGRVVAEGFGEPRGAG